MSDTHFFCLCFFKKHNFLTLSYPSTYWFALYIFIDVFLILLNLESYSYSVCHTNSYLLLSLHAVQWQLMKNTFNLTFKMYKIYVNIILLFLWNYYLTDHRKLVFFGPILKKGHHREKCETFTYTPWSLKHGSYMRHSNIWR